MNRLKTYLLLLITLFIFSLVFTLPALAIVRTVGPAGTVDPTGNTIIYDYNSIQEAIDDAENGDIIWVADGTYTENIDFGNRAITVKSKNGPRKAIIDGAGKGSTVTFQSGENYDSVLQGFTIIKGSWGGIRCSDSSPTISGNIIKNNESNYGGGIRCTFYSHPLIINNFILDNKATVYGGGIFAAWGCYPIVTNNTISNNEAIYIGGGIMSYMSSAPVVKNSIIWGNKTPKGLHVVNGVVEQNVFVYEIITHSDVQLAGGGTYSRWDTKDEENINADPLFMDANNADKDKRDYHLQLGSPCFDKGFDISIFDFNFCCIPWDQNPPEPYLPGPSEPTPCLACCLVDSDIIDCVDDYPKYKDSVMRYYDIDLDGNHRPSDGDRNGTTGFDMGADELGVPFYSQGPSTCDELNYKYGYRKPPPSACGGTWADDKYDDKTGPNDDIQHLGCTITSVVMVLRHYDITTVTKEVNGVTTEEDVNPGTLNTWLINNHGYDKSHNLIWEAIPEYAGNRIKFIKLPSTRDDKILNEDLSNGKPVILKVILSTGRHYVVATNEKENADYDPSIKPNWYIHDAGHYVIDDLFDCYTVKYTENGVEKEKTICYDGTYAGLRRFTPSSPSEDHSSLEIHLCSPAELLLIDPQGRKTGYDTATGSVIEEIPDSGYGVDSIDNLITGEKGLESKILIVNETEAGIYQIQVIGTGSGDFTIDVNGCDQEGNRSYKVLSGTITPDEVCLYEVNYSPEVGSQIEVTPVVAYEFSGFLPPIKEDGSKVFKLGSTIPVKFQLTDKDGNFVSDVTATLTLQQYAGEEPIGEPLDATPTDAADVDNIFRYDTVDNQYIYNLSTKTLAVGIWGLTVTLDDGDAYSVLVGLK